MSLRHILSIIAAMTLAAVASADVLDTLPDEAQIGGYESSDSVMKRMSATPLHDIEGIWEMTGEGSLMAIERAEGGDNGATLYRMVVVRSAAVGVREGTVMGYLTPTSKRGHYEARIYADVSDDRTRLTNPSRNVIIIGDDGSRITFKPYGRKLRFNWWRLLLPYMYRTLITPLENSREDLDGCVRVYPSPQRPLNPRYL